HEEVGVRDPRRAPARQGRRHPRVRGLAHDRALAQVHAGGPRRRVHRVPQAPHGRVEQGQRLLLRRRRVDVRAGLHARAPARVPPREERRQELGHRRRLVDGRRPELAAQRPRAPLGHHGRGRRARGGRAVRLPLQAQAGLQELEHAPHGPLRHLQPLGHAQDGLRPEGLGLVHAEEDRAPEFGRVRRESAGGRLRLPLQEALQAPDARPRQRAAGAAAGRRAEPRDGREAHKVRDAPRVRVPRGVQGRQGGEEPLLHPPGRHAPLLQARGRRRAQGPALPPRARPRGRDGRAGARGRPVRRQDAGAARGPRCARS
ncbi:expressed protein, partial [Aureococcus anophagefferens]